MGEAWSDSTDHDGGQPGRLAHELQVSSKGQLWKKNAVNLESGETGGSSENVKEGEEPTSPLQSSNQMEGLAVISNSEMERLAINLEMTVMNNKTAEVKNSLGDRNTLMEIPIISGNENSPCGKNQMSWKRLPKKRMLKINRSRQRSLG